MKSKIYSSRYMKVSSKGHDVDTGFCDHRISSGISGGRADHAGKLVWNGIHHQRDQCTLCKSVAGWIYAHRTCGCGDLQHCLTESASSGICIHRGKLISITVFR